jgi:hypothetical protein
MDSMAVAAMTLRRCCARTMAWGSRSRRISTQLVDSDLPQPRIGRSRGPYFSPASGPAVT